jgi:hypothetical protein
MKSIFPGLILDPDRDPFPVLPAIKVAGMSVCDSTVIPMLPTVAGTRFVAATVRMKGVQVAISPEHFRLLNSFFTGLSNMLADVSQRAAAAAVSAAPGLLPTGLLVPVCVPLRCNRLVP